MQGLRLKFGDRRNDWKCCFCCHVRTGTIFLGIWHLMLHVLALSVMAVVLRHPELVEQDMDPVLPTPLSEIDDEPLLVNLGPNVEIDLNGGSSNKVPPLPHRDLWSQRAFNHQDMNVGVVVTFCTFAMTLLLVYGAVKGKPSYLMPFFCLQVFDFCIASLTAVGYLCYLPDLSRSIAQSNHIPFKEELLRFKPQTLALMAILLFLVAMTIKAYFIGVVWSCYKYLTLRQVAAQRTIQFIDPDVQNLIPDLPDYDTAVKKFPTPPPSYTAAMAGQYPVVADVPTASNAVVPLPQSPHVVVPAVPISGQHAPPHQV